MLKIFVSFTLILQAFGFAMADTNSTDDLNNFRNTKWYGIYRYMDEVLWINDDLSWTMRFSKKECLKGKSIKFNNNELMLMKRNKFETPIITFKLVEANINGQSKNILENEEFSMSIYLPWESRLGHLIEVEGMLLSDNLQNLSKMPRPQNCK